MRSASLWSADAARQHVAQRVNEASKAASQMGVRPRLVIFDYLDSPVAGQLRAIAQDLGMLVGVEAFERSLPSASLRDRFRLLEKSKGIHGIFFPTALTDAHRACVEAHPILRNLALDREPNGFSPQVISFLQLAALHDWDPEGRDACVVYAPETEAIARALVTELRSARMVVSAIPYSDQNKGALSRGSLIWLCHGRPLALGRLHLPSDAVLIDGGRAMEIPPSLGEAQARLLRHRLRGFCPADQGLASLANLNRVQRLLLRALGPRRPRGTIAPGFRAQGRG